jgi:MFS family permease
METTPTASTRRGRLRPDLHAIRGDGIGYSLMVGVGETYIPAFALALGMSAVQAGLLVSVPLVAGGVLQLAAPFGVRRLGSHRRWVASCAAIQGAFLLPLALAAWRGTLPTPAAFVIMGLYWGAGMAAGPAWNTWVGRLVPARLRASFWAHRTRAMHVAQLAGLLAGGALLQWSARPDVLWPFALLFLAAAASRFYSARCLAAQRDIAPRVPERRHGPEFALRRALAGAGGRLLLFALAMQFAVQVAGPFFTPYLLRELHLSYAAYVALVAASYVAKTLSLAPLGNLARRRGPRALLVVGTLGIVPLPALWLVSSHLVYLLALNALSGVVWAAYELASFLLLFETVSERRRTSVLTAYNLANAMATVGGGLLGGALLGALGAHRAAFAAVFVASSLVRLASLHFLRRVPGVELAATARAAADAAQAGIWRGISPRETTTAAARSPLTLSVVRHMSRKRSTPKMSPMPSVGTPTIPKMSATTGMEPAGTPAVPMPPSTQTSTTSACCASPRCTP